MKRIDYLLIRSFVPPFILTFFIALFVLVMQFLWKYIDDLVGKGLEISIIAELIFYASAGLVPMALPLAILLSSIMAFGNLSEHYELVALKSSGISLIRIMKPLIFVVFILSIIAFWFSNYMLPKANLKYGVLLYDVTHKRPAFDIQAGIFYNGIEGFSIKAESKEEDGRTLNNVLIYDHTKGKGNINVILAERAEMYPDPDGKYLTFRLYNGSQYEEMQAKPKPRKDDQFEHFRTHFKVFNKVFDMSGFEMKNTNEDLFRKNYQMLNILQLESEMDSLQNTIDKRADKLEKQLIPYIKIIDTLQKEPENKPFITENNKFILGFEKHKRKQILKRALSQARNAKSFINVAGRDVELKENRFNKLNMEWHRKFVLSVACIVLFFVGAPLGAITKKGGLGMPMILAILFFIIYHLLSTFGKKFAEEHILTAWQGMWLATLVFLPVGIWLTYLALNDRNVNSTKITTILRRVIGLFKFGG